MYSKIILKNNNIDLGENYLIQYLICLMTQLMQWVLLIKYIMPSLLQMGDRMANSFGIENRCPFR